MRATAPLRGDRSGAPRGVNSASSRDTSRLLEHRSDAEKSFGQDASSPPKPLRGQLAPKLSRDADRVDTGAHFPPSLPVRIVVIDGEQSEDLRLLLREQKVQPLVFVLTGRIEAARVQTALKAGADGYILQANGCADLLFAMRPVLSGKSNLCPEASTLVLQRIQRRRDTSRRGQPTLTRREMDVLKRMANGFSTKEIAFALELSAKTIETHRANLMAKLGLRSIADLTKYALRNGLVNL